MVVLLGLLSLPAAASRPTDLVGSYAFDKTDVLDFVDGPSGAVRVHYSVEGPNQTRDEDDSSEFGGDGVPDFPQEVAATAEDVLDAYAAAGLRLPLAESDLGLEPLGGSDALDFYLIDFDAGDGAFRTDRCQGGVCSGYMIMENDFYFSGYSTVTQGIVTLTSHELFHGVQYAYLDDTPGWISEGTAMWAEYLYDPTSEDFLAWTGRYLQEPERALNRPPSGVASWEYGTGLFFAFLDLQLGPDIVAGILEELAAQGADADLDSVEAAIDAAGGDLESLWITFATWNLATGDRAGSIESYPFADQLDMVPASLEGETIVDDERVYPLATVYLRLDHPGGPLFFGIVEDATGLYVAVHPGEEDAPVDDLVATWWPEGEGAVGDLGDLDAGSYWVVLAQPAIADSSIAFDFCLGDADTLAACGLDVGASDDTGGDPVQPGGCGCGSAAGPGAAAWLALLALAGRRRRRR